VVAFFGLLFNWLRLFPSKLLKLILSLLLILLQRCLINSPFLLMQIGQFLRLYLLMFSLIETFDSFIGLNLSEQVFRSTVRL